VAFTTTNTFGQSTLGVLGIRGYFRVAGTYDWIDLGIVKNWEPQDEIEELEIDGARAGLREVFEVLPIAASLRYSFDSENPNDEDILALWQGGTFTSDGGTGLSAPITFGGNTGELLWVRQNAQATKPSQILYHPSASVRRDGQTGTPGEEAAGLSFQAVVTADEEYTIPIGIDPNESDARYGFLYVVDTDDIGTALDLIDAG
jgi:hypothetical protein